MRDLQTLILIVAVWTAISLILGAIFGAVQARRHQFHSTHHGERK